MLGFEVGNSRVKAGLFQRGMLKKSFASPHNDIDDIFNNRQMQNFHPSSIGIASVVPELNSLIADRCVSQFHIVPEVIKSTGCGVALKVGNPESIGIDRVLNCRGAIALFSLPLIVVDIGTAITVDFVSEGGIFLGGAIMPGPVLWIDSLSKTSMIRGIHSGGRETLIGRDTQGAVKSGLVYGISGAVESIVNGLKGIYPSSVVVVTGGWSALYGKRFSFNKHIKRNLTLEGLGLVLYSNYKKSNE